MNTGIQRSGTTPYLGWTFTSPVGKRRGGKETPPKPMPLIMSAHQIPYVATATIGYPEDYARKLIKAMAVKDGLAYIHLFTPCATGWRFRPDLGIDVCRAAVETNYFPLWEYERRQYRITRVVDKPKPITEYTKLMGKFVHLNEQDVQKLQQLVNSNLDLIRALATLGNQK
jgi:pyruvate/2-oxoacid:ferredoxin oxidoreductase beta subunit